MSKEYKYSNKGKVYTFDTSDLSDEELFKFNRMSDRQKQRFITVFNLNKHNDLTDEVSLKTDKRAQNNDNDKLNKLSVVKRKKEELDDLIEKGALSKDEEIDNNLKEVILGQTTYISPDDFKKNIKKISDLEDFYVSSINNLNVENVENLNITNVKNLTMSVDDLIKKIKDPLQTALPLIINNLSDNQNILNAADRNNISELINILKNDNSKDAKEVLSKLNNEIDNIKEAIEKLANTSVSSPEVIELITKNKNEIISILDDNIQKIEQQVKIPLNVLKAIDISKLTELEEGDLSADNVFNLLVDAGVDLFKRIWPTNKQQFLLFAGDIGYKFYRETPNGEVERKAISDDWGKNILSDNDKHSELSDDEQMKVFVLHCIADELKKRDIGNTNYYKNNSFMTFVNYIESLKKEEKLKQKAREILDNKYGGSQNDMQIKKKPSESENMNFYFSNSNNDLIVYLLFEILHLLKKGKTSNISPIIPQYSQVKRDLSQPSPPQTKNVLPPFGYLRDSASIPSISQSQPSQPIKDVSNPSSFGERLRDFASIPSIPSFSPPQPPKLNIPSIPQSSQATQPASKIPVPETQQLSFLDELKNPPKLKHVDKSQSNIPEPSDTQKPESIEDQLKQQLDKMREDIKPEEENNDYDEDYYGEGLSKISYYDFIGLNQNMV